MKTKFVINASFYIVITYNKIWYNEQSISYTFLNVIWFWFRSISLTWFILFFFYNNAIERCVFDNDFSRCFAFHQSIIEIKILNLDFSSRMHIFFNHSIKSTDIRHRFICYKNSFIHLSRDRQCLYKWFLKTISFRSTDCINCLIRHR